MCCSNCLCLQQCVFVSIHVVDVMWRLPYIRSYSFGITTFERGIKLSQRSDISKGQAKTPERCSAMNYVGGTNV